MTQIEQLLLSLVRIGTKKGNTLKPKVENIDWVELFSLAERQGVSAIALDGINRCFEEGLALNLDFQTKMEWIGSVSQQEVVYKQHEENMMDLATWYKNHDIRMMALKGYGLSLNYPIPNHRPSGDIDIYLFGDQKKADKLLHNELGIEIDKSHHHHTVFNYKGEIVENHYDFLNVHVRRSNRRIEKRLKEIANRDILSPTEIAENAESSSSAGIFKTTTNFTNDTNVIMPSVEFNAIYLLRHCAAHFASTHMSMRQVLDWGLFMEKHHKEINWKDYLPYIKKEGMYRFYNLLGLFCMIYLGFDASIFNVLYEDELLERFSNEILLPEFKDKENGSLLHSLSVKPRRWWHNRWKNRLCYPDSVISEFAYGLWAKFMKPSHFIQ